MKLMMIIITFIFSSAFAIISVDTSLRSYKKISGVSGNLNSVGSDTLNVLMSFWAEGFKKFYPGVNIQIEGKGSSTAPPALIAGVAQLGPMSRKMKSSEIDKFEAKFGYKPTPVKVAIDALAIYVHKENKIEGLNLKELDSIFSTTYRRGGKKIIKWRDLKKNSLLIKNMFISVYGRNSASGTYGYFKKIVLKEGDYASTVKEQPGSSAVIQAISRERNSIGYSGIGYKTSGVTIVPISVKNSNYYDPTQANCLNGKYPLARFLIIYINQRPKRNLDKLTVEFLKYVLSKEGQIAVAKSGYYPLPKKIINKILRATR